MYIVAKDHTYLGEWKNSSYTFLFSCLERASSLEETEHKSELLQADL